LSLEEVATLYQGILEGRRFDAPGTLTLPGAIPGLRSASHVQSPDSATMLIAEIRDRHGNVLYRAGSGSQPVADVRAGRQVGDILRNVVRWGTGRRAREAALVGEGLVPLAGKTGTTNGFKNAAFCGFVPRVQDGRWQWGSGYTVAAYVGYDDNRPMSRGSIRLAGASGALPAWLATARGMAEAGLLGLVSPAESEWWVEPDYQRLQVAEGTGLPEGTSGRTGDEGVAGASSDLDQQARSILVRMNAESVVRTFTPEPSRDAEPVAEGFGGVPFSRSEPMSSESEEVAPRIRKAPESEQRGPGESVGPVRDAKRPEPPGEHREDESRRSRIEPRREGKERLRPRN
ncbi:MAG: hypothetical protein QGG40_01095, partial [Myxococcota bacterium]|nr:hypothetical protein [Myxococcota bacterium]